MPIYTFRNKETGDESDHLLKISEYDQFKADNPHLERVINSAPALGDSMRLGVRRTDDNFNSLLKHIKKGNSKGITKSTINTR